jgi:hypothetical protein
MFSKAVLALAIQPLRHKTLKYLSPIVFGTEPRATLEFISTGMLSCIVLNGEISCHFQDFKFFECQQGSSTGFA